MPFMHSIQPGRKSWQTRNEAYWQNRILQRYAAGVLEVGLMQSRGGEEMVARVFRLAVAGGDALRDFLRNVLRNRLLQ